MLHHFKKVLWVQITYLALSIIWNVVGTALIALELRAPGPTASLMAAGVLFVFGALIVWTYSRVPLIHAAISLLVGLLAASAAVNGFRASPDLWPSDFWRFAGIALNSLGFTACLTAVVGYLISMARSQRGK